MTRAAPPAPGRWRGGWLAGARRVASPNFNARSASR